MDSSRYRMKAIEFTSLSHHLHGGRYAFQSVADRAGVFLSYKAHTRVSV